MRRRGTPYSQMTQVRAGRGELLVLVVLTLGLGILLGLLTDGLYEWLRARLTSVSLQCATFWLGVLAALGLVLFAAWLLGGRTESEPVGIELAIPYHLLDAGGGRRLAVVREPAYQVTTHARRAVMRRFPAGSQPLQECLDGWGSARDQGQQFKSYAQQLHAELAQCLLLYALHRYGRDSLGPKAAHGWWKNSMSPAEWKIDDLPPSLAANPFLLADQRRGAQDNWKLLLPAGVTLHLEQAPASAWPRWELRHVHYGRISITWFSAVSVAGVRSKTFRALTQRLRPGPESEIHVLTSRLVAQTHINWALWKGSDPFHQWATGLLARLEESLDLGYFFKTRPARILTDLDWKVGWVDTGDSLVDTLARLEARLDALEMNSLEPLGRDENE